MGWLDRLDAKKKEENKIPPELEGKTPEQIVASLKEAEGLRVELQAAKANNAKLSTQYTEMNTEVDKIKAELASRDAAQNQQRTNQTEELANFVEDPDKAFGQRVAPLAQVAVNTAAMTARMLAQQQLNNQDMASPAEARSMDGRLFQAWSVDIDAEARKYPQIQLATPQAWLGIFYYLKGTRADDLANPEIRKKKYGNFIESGVSSVAPRAEPEKKDELTDAEKHVADKMKVSYENYAKRKKQMQFVPG